MGSGGVPTYSESALAVRDIFFAGVADVHFFVEDEDQENLYEVIFRRAFPKLKSFKVFPLKGKSNVLFHAAAGHAVIAGTKRVYVLDKDFDDLLGTCVVQPDIFYLDDYCIESAVIDEKAVLQFAVEESPRIRLSALRTAIAYQQSMDAWLPYLDRLHRAFFLVQKHSLGIRNCDCPPDLFVSVTGPLRFDESQVGAYIDSVVDLLIANGVISCRDDYIALSRSAFGSKRINRRHISGKFLLKLVIRSLRYSRICGNVRADSVVIRFARNSELARLRDFKRRVNQRLAA